MEWMYLDSAITLEDHLRTRSPRHRAAFEIVPFKQEQRVSLNLESDRLL